MMTPAGQMRVLLAMEKEVTGVYISGHPLDEYRRALSGLQMNTALLEEMKPRWRERYD